MKKRLGPLERLFPMPAVLVVGGTIDEADTLAVAWINVISSSPPTIAMGLRATRRTLELIRANGGAFTVNVPDTSLVAQLDYCGIVSGRKSDKFVATGLTLTPGAVVTAPIIEECPYNIECLTTHEVEVGDYVVVLGEIVEVHADERILREGTDIVEMDALDPLVYIAGAREYRGLGPKIADAYKVGNEFRKDVADE
jgi:flavin reductase (DIM6/NTAB) family NADH-FMN oxidoreductase RutF